MPKICVFDTETTSIEKPFVYNIGYTIFDTDSREILVKEDFVVEQVWHNAMLFTTAYYADKREIYVSRMKGRTCRMEKLGYITRRMYHLFKEHEVVAAYAYNAPFDIGVFEYNCDWFKVINPFDDVPIYDIRGYVMNKIAFRPDFQQFCDEYEYYTEKGNYSTTAETLFRYIAQNTDFTEEHTALADSLIELDILCHCVDMGCEWHTEYKVYRSVPRKADKVLVVRDVNGEEHEFPYQKITDYKEKGNRKKILLKTLDK